MRVRGHGGAGAAAAVLTRNNGRDFPSAGAHSTTARRLMILRDPWHPRAMLGKVLAMRVMQR